MNLPKLPFLKNHKLPRIQNGPLEVRHYGRDDKEERAIEQGLIDEVWEAIRKKDVGSFRQATEALVARAFEESEERDASSLEDYRIRGKDDE